MKFKVGDKVRIVKNVWRCPKVALVEVGIGEVHEIVACYPGERYPYALDAYYSYTWCDEELELVSRELTIEEVEREYGIKIKFERV